MLFCPRKNDDITEGEKTSNKGMGPKYLQIHKTKKTRHPSMLSNCCNYYGIATGPTAWWPSVANRPISGYIHTYINMEIMKDFVRAIFMKLHTHAARLRLQPQLKFC